MFNKQCRKCGEIKPISEFYNNYTKYGIYKHSYCKHCASHWTSWKKNNSDKQKKMKDKWTKDNIELVRNLKRKYRKEITENLSDPYIKTLLHLLYKIPQKEIPIEWINEKRKALVLKREFRQYKRRIYGQEQI
jgi:hypothetical protein